MGIGTDGVDAVERCQPCGLGGRSMEQHHEVKEVARTFGLYAFNYGGLYVSTSYGYIIQLMGIARLSV